VSHVTTCPRCRALLEKGTRVCPYCGTKPGRAAPPSREGEAIATSRLGLWVIAIHLVIYVLMLLLYPPRGETGGERYEPSGYALVAFGVSDWGRIVVCGHYWRLLTSIFMHLDVLHLLFNSIAVFILVPPAAFTFGPHRTTCLYLLTGVLAGYVSHLLGNQGAGASGALCGLIGALAVYGWRRGGEEGRQLTRRMITWAVIILVWGFLFPGIDNAAHGAGFVSGAAFGYFAAAARVIGGRADRAWRMGAYFGIGLVVLVGAVFLLPNVLRSFDRREAVLYRAEVKRTLRLISKVAAGEESASKLPRSFEEGPGDTGAIEAAMRAALHAARTDPEGAECAEACRLARVAWADWQVRTPGGAFRREPGPLGRPEAPRQAGTIGLPGLDSPRRRFQRMKAKVFAALLCLAGLAAAQSMEARLEKKLARGFVKNAPWEQDYEAALKRSADSGKLIFAYFTRSYAP
jgi:rhomboid protease GluP